MARLFNRQCTVIVDGVLIEGLRSKFTITKSLSKEPNTCDLQIYNLSSDSQARLQGRGSKVIIEAGYPDTVAQIFSGDSRTIDHVRQGADMVTKVQCGDGERAYRYARVSESFRAGTPVRNVVLRVLEQAKAKGLDVSGAADALSDLSAQFSQGYAVYGEFSRELDKLLRGRGYEWSIQDGRVQILKSTTTSGNAVLLSSDTGMIGSPEHGAPDKKGGPSLLKVKSLLQPSIKPGGLLRIDAEKTKGDYRVKALRHLGDTHGGEWYTDIEANPIS